MTIAGEAIVKVERGRKLRGDGVSEKCRTGRHDDCAAERCQCDCLHGAIPSLLAAFEGREIHVELPSGATARVDPRIQPETLSALDEMMSAVVRQVKTQVLNDRQQNHGIKFERNRPNDEITFANLTASLGRRGTGRQTAETTTEGQTPGSSAVP